MEKKNITNKYDFVAIEQEVEKQWELLEDSIFDTTQFDDSKPLFSWLEGPPTANAPPGLHHVEARVFKDVMARYKYMQGFSVPRKGGWDCHGLPVEVQVEKKLGLKTKKDVLTYGIKEFNKECRSDIFVFINEWEKMTKKAGVWMDMRNPYRTLDNTFVESVWWSLKELYTKGLLYEGHKVVPYCPRCETPLSSHEVALGYKDVTEETVTAMFQDKEKPSRYYLSWTTTPWTLPGNACLAVHKSIDYLIIKKGDKEYVIAKNLVHNYFLEDEYIVVKEVKGEELVGKQYTPLFPYFKDAKNAFVIVSEDYVTTEEGTGIVHQATYGEVDLESLKNHDIERIHPVQKDGTFSDEVTDFKGLFVKDADPKIIAFLDDKKMLFKGHPHTHSYPHCWRCDTPLLYYPLVSWFIAVSKVRDRLVEKNQEIQWAPEHIKDGRFGKWLEGAKDWALSRHKFWGSPLPIWRCEECEHTVCIGSVEELNKKHSGDKELTLKTLDLHKPEVDTITIPCDKCGKVMTRTPDVIDCWYDSGAASFAQFHYPFENKELFEKQFPYSFITEAIDQTRGWFYTLHVLGVLLFDSVAYKKCYVAGLLSDDNGEKMSKSKGNIVKPFETFAEQGVDAVRLLMVSYPFGESVRYGPSVFKDVINPFLRVLWNSFYYVISYLKDKHVLTIRPEKLAIEDEWIVSRMNNTISIIEEGMDGGSYSKSTTALRTFVIEDFSRTYIKLVRARTQENDEALAYTFSYCLTRIISLLAPFAPYAAESMYTRFDGSEKSVHFTSWPKKEEINTLLETTMILSQQIISSISHAREKAKLGGRWPLKKVFVQIANVSDTKLSSLEPLIKEQVNVKEIVFVDEVEGVHTTISLNEGVIRREFKKNSNDVLKELKEYDIDKIFEEVQSGREHRSVNDARITAQHFKVTLSCPEHLVNADNIYIDITRTTELDAEGYARELMRRLQDLRKKAGLKKEDRANIEVVVPKDFVLMLQPWKQEVQEKTGAKKFVLDDKSNNMLFQHQEEIKIKKLVGTIKLEVL